MKCDYELTDEMFEAFGLGKLKVERVEDKPREYRVAYDSMQIDNSHAELKLLWKGIVVARLSFKDVYLGPHDTLTLQDLHGFVPFKLVR